MFTQDHQWKRLGAAVEPASDVPPGHLAAHMGVLGASQLRQGPASHLWFPWEAGLLLCQSRVQRSCRKGLPAASRSLSSWSPCSVRPPGALGPRGRVHIHCQPCRLSWPSLSTLSGPAVLAALFPNSAGPIICMCLPGECRGAMRRAGVHCVPWSSARHTAVLTEQLWVLAAEHEG